MVTKDKVLNLTVPFKVKEHHDDEEKGEGEDLHITGHASTNDEDRTGDIIVTDAWRKSGALDNYLKNPVILAFHDMSRPIGKTIDHEVDSKGLKITAKISKAAGDILELIKDGILSAFSVGFMIKDADFDADHGIFIIKELELYEVSVVSIPANQNALFSIEKNFRDQDEYLEFRKQFIKESEETLMVDKTKDKENASDPIDVAALASQISAMVKGDLKAEQEEKEAQEKADKEAADKIELTATTAAERIVEDLKSDLLEKDKELNEALSDIREALKKESEEVEKILDAENKGKMKFVEPGTSKFDQLSTNQKDGIIIVSKLFGMKAEDTDTFRNFVKKSGMEHWESGVDLQWEEEYTTRVFDALREMLVVEPVFQGIPMNTPTMHMPINPEAGDATWIQPGAYRSTTAPWDETGDGTDTSTGSAQDHQIGQQTLIAYKLATREYVGYEEEEDSIVTLAPIIRDAVARRMARSADRALLRGAGDLTVGAGYDPILGLAGMGSLTTNVTVTSSPSWEANFVENDIVDMRRNLRIYGLNPDELVLLCSHDLYYQIMKLDNFKTVNTLGLDRATLRTGEVGELFGVPVLVSQSFDNAAITANTSGTVLGIMCRASNFIVGNHRGLLTEADRDIVNQKRVLVSSRRFGFQEIIAGQGTVNLEIA